MHLILPGLFLYSSIKNGCSNWISIVIREKRHVQNKESWLTSLFLFNNACQTCYNNTEIRHKNKINFGYLVLVFTIFFLRGILGMKNGWIFRKVFYSLFAKISSSFWAHSHIIFILLSEAPENSYCIRI